MRILIVAVYVAWILFCIYGFWSSWEPGGSNWAWVFRLAYPILAVVFIVLTIKELRRKPER